MTIPEIQNDLADKAKHIEELRHANEILAEDLKELRQQLGVQRMPRPGDEPIGKGGWAEPKANRAY